MNSNDKKSRQLGMPIGTASGRLRKTIIFELLKQLDQNICFQCGTKIESENELSIEHKIPYLDSEDPQKLFFDLDNIAFSHLKCNCGAANRKGVQKNTRSSCGYKGVVPPTNRHTKFRAKIKINGHYFAIGSYATKEEAALAYNEKAKEVFGNKAILNYVDIV